MNINSPYPHNPADMNRAPIPTKAKRSVWRVLVMVVIAAVVIAGGYTVLLSAKRAKDQTNLIKAANESFAADPRYISFGADYLFAVPKSYTVDEYSIDGVQLLIPSGVESASLDNFDKLFDAAVIAVQPLTNVKPNSNRELRKYIDEVLVPDLKEKVSQDVTTTYSYTGKYQSATVVIKKDGRPIRHIYAYSGAKPFTVVAQTKSEAFMEVVDTTISLSDSTSKTDIDQIKQVVQTNLGLAQTSKSQELFDGSASEFKQKSTAKDVATALTNSTGFLKRNIIVHGGTFLGSQFVGQLFFPGVEKDEKANLGTIGLLKESDWKLNSLVLPTPLAPAPAPVKKK